ncbi:CoA ester lyase [Rhodococcus globerulus]|uniref:HpcH/HpaI aldolase/citrate lyase family protein n=1 Tax=Rhodococcus globerulus TaxID=33008 RepID=UPI00301A33AC
MISAELSRHDAGRRLPRSYLYVPGTAPSRFEKAVSSGADAVIFDLEDAVPVVAKSQARRHVADFLSDPPRDDTVELWVRINPGSVGLEDLSALGAASALTGVVQAKANLHDLGLVDTALANSPLLVSPLIETPESVLRIQEILRAPRVTRVQLGEYDLCAAVGLDPDQDENETSWARSQVVFACASAESTPPVAPVSIETRDLDAFRASTDRARRQGFFGRVCIHPRQVPVVQEIFTPSPEAVERARRMLELFDASVAAGHGATVDESGRMIDEAVVRTARRTLAGVRQPV